MSGIFIAGTGKYIPSAVVTNDDMAKVVDTSDEWIRERTGIRERHFSAGETTSQMGVEAAREAIARAGVEPASIDMIIGTTVTPDYYYPSLACVVQAAVGAENAFCWDLNAACSGFIYALDAAQSYLALGKASTVLIVSSEELSKQVDFTDRSTCVLFGDGAGAVVVRGGRGMYHSWLRSEGSAAAALTARALVNHSPYAAHGQAPENEPYPMAEGSFIHMAGRDVYRFATHAMAEALRGACERASISPQDLEIIVPHQANVRIIRTAAEKLGVDMARMYVNLDRYGNTSSASIPIALSELEASGRLRRGDTIGLVGFGAGLTYGAAVLEY